MVPGGISYFMLLVPPIRRRVRRYLAARYKAQIAVHTMGGFGEADSQTDENVIDAEHHPTDDA